jgi:hypothetical protein
MGVGKTSSIEQFRPRLEQEKDILISISYSVEKQRIDLQSLISALTMGLSFDDARLQMHLFIWRALEEAFEASQNHASIETLRETVACDLQDKESRLVRLGYNARRLADILRVKEGDVRFYFAGKLAPEKHKEIDEGIQNLGLLDRA